MIATERPVPDTVWPVTVWPGTVRAVTDGDMAAVTAIYGHHVLHGKASFEEKPPTEEDMRGRQRAVLDGGYPYLVAERNGQVVGYAYAGPYRTRPAYRYSVENSVYVAPGQTGGGVGSALLGALIQACEASGFRQMIAIIGDSANGGSIALHDKLGFRHIGTLSAVGFKQGVWVDSVIMQRPLNEGETTLPDISVDALTGKLLR